MKNRLCIIYISLFMLIMIVPLALTNTQEGFVSDIDNRELVDAPEWGEDGFTDKLELYLQDRIGIRNQMIRVYGILNDVVAGELTHPLYSYGKNGYIFFTQHDNIVFSDYHKSFAEMVYKMQQYCNERGTDFYFVFNPEKTSVLREELRNGESFDDSWVDNMKEYMESLGVSYVDNKELLSQIHREESVFNKKYDAGHWNDRGCFFGTNNLLARIHEDWPEVKELRSDEFDISTETKKYLPNSEFVVNEEVPVFSLKTPYLDLTKRFNNEVTTNNNHRYFHYWKNNASNSESLPTVLMFQGSYYIGRSEFIVSRTNEYYGVHNYQNVMDLDYYYNLFHPDIVVFEVAEYTVNNNYFSQEAMKQIDWNPSVDSGENEAGNREQADDLLGDAEYYTSDASIKLIKGKAIDELFLDKRINNAKGVYLITEDCVFDMDNQYRKQAVAVKHGVIKEGDIVKLYYITNDGEKRYCTLPVAKAREINLHTIKRSNNALYEDEEKGFQISTSIKNNIFSYVVLQQWNEKGEYIKKITTRDAVGKSKGCLINGEGDGEYKIILRANSNIQDEWLEYDVELKKGQVCFYAFSLDELTRKRVSISDFKLYF